jgi:hypothetical protein
MEVERDCHVRRIWSERIERHKVVASENSERNIGVVDVVPIGDFRPQMRAAEGITAGVSELRALWEKHRDDAVRSVRRDGLRDHQRRNV